MSSKKSFLFNTLTCFSASRPSIFLAPPGCCRIDVRQGHAALKRTPHPLRQRLHCNACARFSVEQRIVAIQWDPQAVADHRKRYRRQYAPGPGDPQHVTNFTPSGVEICDLATSMQDISVERCIARNQKSSAADDTPTPTAARPHQKSGCRARPSRSGSESGRMRTASLTLGPTSSDGRRYDRSGMVVCHVCS